MKTLTYLFFYCTLLLSSSNCANAQNNIADKQAMQVIKEFYEAHNTAWSAHVASDVLSNKLDLLQKKYCTQKLRKEAKEWLEDGHDLFTNDWGIDNNSLKTMTIVKENVKGHAFAVSYIVVSFPVSPDKPVKKRVTLHVGVVKEGENYKIASVK